MNKLCVLAKNKETYFIKRLIEEVGQGLAIFDPWSDMILPESEFYLVRTTGVYKSDLDLMFIQSLPQNKTFNSLKAIKIFRSKYTQYQWFDENDIPSLPWLSVKEHDLLTIEKFLALYPEVVVKPTLGQGGWGIEVLNRENIKTWYKKHDRDYLIQPFVKDARELRYFFIQDQKPIVLERSAKSGITANFRKEGISKLTTLPEEFTPVLDKLVKLSGAHYGAVDLFIQGNELYILELNLVPGIEQLESVSGENIIKGLIHSLNE